MITGKAIYALDMGNRLKEVFDEEAAIKEMVADDKLEIFFNDEQWHVGVNASDMFYFASDDHVEIESSKALEALYRSCVADPKTGHVAWASKARNMQPCRRCYIDPMKAAGIWTEELEALPKGPQS